MKRHECPGDDCGHCEQRIAAIEYGEADFDVPEYYDGT